MIEGLLIATAIIVHAILKGYFMALDRTAIDNGVQAVTDALDALGTALAQPNPAVAEAQAALNDVGDKLQAFAADVSKMKDSLSPVV